MDERIWKRQLLDRHSPVPLYQQLCDILINKIHEEELPAGAQLPSENELISLYGVSRFVVRQSLNSLGRQGLIHTEQGKGSFVSLPKIIKPLEILQSYHQVMKKAGIDVDVRIISKTFVLPPAHIAEKLAISPKEEVMLLERLAYLKDTPVNLLISYLPPGTWGLDRLATFNGGSLYKHLSEVCGISLNRSVSEIEVIFADEYESRILNQIRGAVLLQIAGISYDKSGLPVEYSRVVYPGAMFGFRFESFLMDENDHSNSKLMGSVVRAEE
jgi:GntR family transcriptional regulator